ncbi:insulinoma-associated protein 1-like [Fopius arisanus]|uniref:Insulinoma-associated protein 1-like n=1 Tax=Fopius arisanus TaxID=64838 RepID=A0A9R1T6A6_9HYME|nr:PREDICTED: insulinoma-associated protein 1-like [Fopius arisanus]
MLHSTLPRAFIPPPSLCYLGGYYSDSIHPYVTPRYLPLETYQSHPQAVSPEISVSPSPLDLSVKPSTTSQINDESETIEVDDVEDYPEKPYPNPWDSIPEEPRTYYDHPQDIQKSSTVKPGHLYPEPLGYRSPSPVTPKHHLSSPRSIHDYQQQLLLTPQHHLQLHAPMTPPSTPSPPQCPRRRPRDEDDISSVTPTATPKSSNYDKTIQRPKKKHARRLKFDEDTSSPVSGTVILGPDEAVVTGDIDPAFNIVEVTEEARAELAKIENRLGPYQCKLCRQLHDDAFQLAQHRCSRIAHVEYRCPECDKRFSCPANLASHRRWHKPRIPPGENTPGGIEISCGKCDAKFSRQAALRKHLVTQHPEDNTTNNNNKLVCHMELHRQPPKSPDTNFLQDHYPDDLVFTGDLDSISCNFGFFHLAFDVCECTIKIIMGGEGDGIINISESEIAEEFDDSSYRFLIYLEKYRFLGNR